MDNLRKWVELIGVISLLIGIGLVFSQMRQNEEMLRFQIATDLRVNRDNDRFAMRGENYSNTLAKLQTEPQNLTDAELLAFDAHAWSLVLELIMRKQLAEASIFTGDWRMWLEEERCVLLNNSVGQVWLKTQRSKLGEYEYAMDEEMLDGLEQQLGECSRLPSFLESVRDGQDE